MKIDIAKAFKSKKSRYGGYAALITAIFLAILIVINLIASSLDYKVDLTKNKIYSLSDSTYKVLGSLNKDIHIIAFYESGNEDPTISQILNKYSAGSKKVTVEYTDPVKYPQYAKKYSDGNEISSGSVVVESGNKFKFIDANDMFNYTYDQSGQQQIDSLAVEQRVTGAIMYVTSDKTSVVYNLQGHGEGTLPDQVSKSLEDQNYTIKDINLSLKDSKLEDSSTLLIMAPTKDFSQDETTAIKDFLTKGGRAVVLCGYAKADTPNFNSILASYGVAIKKTLIVEGDPNYSASNPLYLFPEMKSHDILNPLSTKKIPVIIPASQAIDKLNIKKGSTTIETLLSTTDKSYGKANLQSKNINKESGDYSGPFDIAVAITDKSDSGDTSKDTKLVVVADEAFADPQFVQNGGNADFLVNSFNWLQDKKDNITVSPKSLDTGILNINLMQQLLLSGLVVIVIPLVVVILGIRVWLRRRHQ